LCQLSSEETRQCSGSKDEFFGISLTR